MRPRPLAPHFCQEADQYQAILSHLSLRHRVWCPGLVWSRSTLPKGHISAVALFNISSAEFPPVTSRT